MWKEFREFIMRGNVIDLAVGIVIGAAFTAIVTSLVNDIIMPPIGYIFGDVDFSEIVITLGEGDEGPVTINIGLFINSIVNFLLVATAIFFIIRGINRAREQFEREKEAEEKVEEAVAEPTVEERLLETLEKLNKTLDEKM